MRQLSVVAKMLALVLLSLFSVGHGDFPVEKKASDTTLERDESVNYRLPSSLKPLHYDITLEPVFSPDFTFTGQILIEVQVVEATSTIILHGSDLDFNQANVRVKEKNAVEYNIVTSLNYDSITKFYSVQLRDALRVGSVVDIEIDYTGVLNSDNDGFYRASYIEDGVTKWFATTQFESNSARRAFPCFDEPALKATFTIHIIRPASYNAISNMKLETTTELGTSRFKDTFEKSVLMSTYLVAFIVSEMTAEVRGSHAMYGPKYRIDDGRGVFSVQASIDILKAMEDFTEVEYALDKMYQVSIPDEYFSADVMENWGLVTYREAKIMYKDGMSTSAEKQSTLSIIAHGHAHQWFGNLVSPLWWSYLWMKEGFATYFEYYAVEAVDPSLRMMDQFVTSTVQYAFQTDALETTRPMTSQAESTVEIDRLFDRVAYDKSGAVIRMMEHILTTPVYRKGLTYYLKEMAFAAAQATDLWRGLQKAVNETQTSILQGQNVQEIMETWNSQAGFPVIILSRGEDGVITLTQERFLLEKATHEYDTIWTIPINYATASDPNFESTATTYWLKTKSAITDIKVDEGDWIILNKQETGYYRVNYDQRSWDLIIDYLNSDDWSRVHVLNRAQLLDDSFNLARSGRISYDVALRLSMYLTRESDYIPITSFLTVLSYLNNHLSGSEKYYPLFKEYVKEVLQGGYKVVGNDLVGNHLDIKNRLNLINWLCRFEDEVCLQSMHDRFVQYSPVEPDLQSAVYCGGLRLNVDMDEKWEYAYSKYHETVESAERSRWLSALGCSLNVTYLDRILDMTIGFSTPYTLRSGDITSALSAVYSSSAVGLDSAFYFIIFAFDDISIRLSTSQISSLLNGVASRISSERKLRRLNTFISSQSTDVIGIYGSMFNRAAKTIAANIKLYNTHIESIGPFLTEWFEETTTEEPTESSTESSAETEESSVETSTEDPDSKASFVVFSVPLLFITLMFTL